MRPVLKLTGAEATANHLLDEGPNFDTLHLVTHGFFTDPSVKSISQAESIPSQTDGPEVNANQFIDTWDAGLLSGLVMAGVNQKKASEGRNEGILLASEIETASLSDVDLVVLSACESGLGAVAGGEGLSGLQRSFQLAGARTVIASLWKVDDLATRELMHRFYFNYWIRRQSKLDALRNAQLDLLRNPQAISGGTRGLGGNQKRVEPASLPTARRLDPRYWAAFQLSGDWR